jgi:xylan 1,4-beta-xylosidase
MRFAILAGLILLPGSAPAQQEITINVNANATVGAFKPIWAYFGYDEPNYTYTKNGVKLVRELGAMARTPVYIRAHNLLTTGNGQPALKWGSTNAYTENATGDSVYDWTITDRIFDTYIQAKAKPFVEIGFMPEALSTHPQPYQHSWPKTKIAAGWAYPPKDFEKWRELVFQWVKHCIARYGVEEVNSWYWEVWNEPDIEYWQGTPDEYNRLYDFAVDGVKRAAPRARVGGPATTGPASPKAAAFLRQFLEHCATGANAATGKHGAPLDFITYHAKGRPNVVASHVQMGLGKNLQDVSDGMQIVTSFPQFRGLPIILSESDPEGCAACSARVYPQNAYRNGALYPCYTAAAMSNIFTLADQHKANIEGMLTWAFEFENQPYFDGFRTLATNGIDKPVLNVFRMAAKMTGDRVPVESSGSIPVADIMESGVRNNPFVDSMATKSAGEISALIWNYHDDDLDSPAADVRLIIAGVPPTAKQVIIRHYRIDNDHSNSYTLWKSLGSPQSPTPEQYSRLEAAGHLQELGPAESVPAKSGKVELHFSLPRQGVSLVQASW